MLSKHLLFLTIATLLVLFAKSKNDRTSLQNKKLNNLMDIDSVAISFFRFQISFLQGYDKKSNECISNIMNNLNFFSFM